MSASASEDVSHRQVTADAEARPVRGAGRNRCRAVRRHGTAGAQVRGGHRCGGLRRGATTQPRPPRREERDGHLRTRHHRQEGAARRPSKSPSAAIRLPRVGLLLGKTTCLYCGTTEIAMPDVTYRRRSCSQLAYGPVAGFCVAGLLPTRASNTATVLPTMVSQLGDAACGIGARRGGKFSTVSRISCVLRKPHAARWI